MCRTDSVAIFVKRVVLFGVLSAITYVAMIFVTVNAPEGIRGFIGRKTNLYPLAHVRWWAYPGGDSFLRFRELPAYNNVDVLFMGSSHAFKSFDPRLFSRHKLTSFNMGSRAQTPLNSYYLLRKHIAHLNPRLIIFETYYDMLARDGLESLLELLENLPLDRELCEMAWATHNVCSMNALLARELEIGRTPLDSLSAVLFPQDVYVEGGYVETRSGYQANMNSTPHRITLDSRQVEYLEDIIQLVKDHQVPLVLVVQPLPRGTRNKILNRHEVSRRIADVAATHGVQFLDFNEGPFDDGSFLESDDYYMDYHHLNQDGVVIFNEKLILELQDRDLMPAPR